MNNEKDMGRLEQFVENLLASHNELKKNYDTVIAALRQKEHENDDLLKQVESLQGDRNIMRNRVTGLIDKMEQWETAQNDNNKAPKPAEKKQSENTAEGPLPIFSAGAEQKIGSATR